MTSLKFVKGCLNVNTLYQEYFPSVLSQNLFDNIKEEQMIILKLSHLCQYTYNNDTNGI